ncbi:MAG: DNA alkylation repair protein [Bacteroidia bacterium]|nr:DNA alkylation repair protein [Bacteroidia bacterium]
MSQNYLQPLAKLFNDNANMQRAQATAKYFKNNFVFYGFDSATRRQLIKNFYRENGVDSTANLVEIATWAFSQPQREWQYFAMEHVHKHRKHWTPETMKLLHFMLTNKSWWDTVDFLATHSVCFAVTQMPQLLPTVQQWNKSDNMWLIRTSIIFQNLQKDKTNKDLLFAHIIPHLQRKEFFIQKAIGWALRQYATTNAQAVIQFCQAETLPALSKREALKHF